MTGERARHDEAEKAYREAELAREEAERSRSRQGESQRVRRILVDVIPEVKRAGRIPCGCAKGQRYKGCERVLIHRLRDRSFRSDLANASCERISL